MQNSAISSSFCVNNDPILLPRAIEELSQHFDVKYNTGLHLFTIRHHNPEVRQALLNGREPLLEQITRETWQVVVGG
jgi:aspartate kinase